MIEAAQQQIWTSLKRGQFAPPYVFVSFCDLKKYIFHYTLGFPSVQPIGGFRVVSAKGLADVAESVGVSKTDIEAKVNGWLKESSMRAAGGAATSMAAHGAVEMGVEDVSASVSSGGSSEGRSGSVGGGRATSSAFPYGTARAGVVVLPGSLGEVPVYRDSSTGGAMGGVGPIVADVWLRNFLSMLWLSNDQRGRTSEGGYTVRIRV